jgi:hypothetical protein
MIEKNAPFYVKGFLASGSGGDLDCILSKSCLGNVSELPHIATATEINDVVITDEDIDKEALIGILDYCIEQRLNVWFSPKLLPIINLKIQPDYMCGLPMIKLCTQKRSEFFNKVKHGLDALIALPVFIFLLPVFSIIALAIKLNSEGPVFYMADRKKHRDVASLLTKGWYGDTYQKVKALSSERSCGRQLSLLEKLAGR